MGHSHHNEKTNRWLPEASEHPAAGQPAAGLWKSHGMKIIIGLVLSLVFLGLALYKINLAKVVQTFRQVHFGWLLASAGSILVAYYFRSLLWRILLMGHKPINLGNAFRIITIGYFANNVLPLKLGELVRAWLLSKREGLTISLSLAVVVLERGVDLLCMMFYFILMMFIVPFENWLKVSGLLLAIFGGGFFLALILNYRFGGHLLEYIEKPLARLPGNIGRWLHRQMDAFLEGLKLIKNPGQFMAGVGVTLLSWLAWIMVTYLCFWAAGLQLPFFAAVFLIVVLNMGLMIPSSPGGLGVFEFMVILALAKYGVAKETALGFAVVFHMIQAILVIVLGWIFTVQMNVSMWKLSQESMRSGQDQATPPN
ncbi:flippase-like domain-containing protein [candidate division FCPU426 bacterium]|nr:flippase-like domain-containing protein [candidate division FCPU426 bacterium]